MEGRYLRGEESPAANATRYPGGSTAATGTTILAKGSPHPREASSQSSCGPRTSPGL
jgi:hypothetical protein